MPPMPEHIFLSAHLDDAVYSCGGLIHRLIQNGEPCTVLTVFAGDPPPGELSAFAQELHQRWQLSTAPVAGRRREDLAACGQLGAAALHFGLPEALYRKGESGEHLYPSEMAIFGSVHPEDRPMVSSLTEALNEVGMSGSQVYSPLGLGGHIDHLILRAASEGLSQALWYYRDFPYTMRGQGPSDGPQLPEGVLSVQPLGEDDLAAWVDASACYTSQESTFWDDKAAMAAELADYLEQQGGMQILAPASTRN